MTLVTQKDLESAVYANAAWHRSVLKDLGDRLKQPNTFPCLFSQNAFARKLLMFSFVEAETNDDFAKAAKEIAEYIDVCRLWDGKVSTAHPLIVAFSQNVVRGQKLAFFHETAWRFLQFLHDNDPSPWPEGVCKEPDEPYWSMCYAGMQIFVNISNPAHIRRKSRNLGDRLVLVINPRERFDIVAGNSPEGRRVRKTIRSRIAAYDNQPHAPQLGSYQAGEIEWWQYGLEDDNTTPRGRCPFRFAHSEVEEH